MKTTILVAIALSTLLVHQSLFAQSPSKSAVDSVSRPKREYVMADIAGFPFNHTHSGSWRPYQSFRVGYGRDLQHLIELRVFAEYSQLDFDAHDGLANQDYSLGQRRDYAIYPAVGAFGIFEFALGGYYTVQDEIIHRSVFSPYLTIDPVVKKFGLYIHFGAGGTIHLGGPLSCSLGILLRNTSEESTQFGCRAGLKFEI